MINLVKNTQLLQVERDPEPLRLDLGLEAGPMQGVPTTHQAGGAHCWLNPLSNCITILTLFLPDLVT